MFLTCLYDFFRRVCGIVVVSIITGGKTALEANRLAASKRYLNLFIAFNF